ncbi:CU044_2847 family protein [Actinoplanes sp. M2I2]|uniref:CU044_2847 family protein n=1 Tax=Actinoplanes sp. M2I2 TaxID=1734444 RepID=UPI0020200BC5|nr:CU044_2847 family protein [Actinoplanes sp. M2I2]
MANELLRLQADDGSAVLVEIDGPDTSSGEVAFDGAAFIARDSLERSLVDVRTAALKTLDVFREAGDVPESIELEFGVTFRAESATAVLARNASDGHVVVRLTWSGHGHPVGRPWLEGDDDAE